jgi:hypothetical protein
MRTTRRWLPVPLLALSLSAAARADTAVPPAPPEDPARAQLLSRSLPLARGDHDKDASPEPAADAFRFHLNEGAGLEISKPVRFADHELVFGLKGPLMKRNRVGLAFEIRF